VERRQLLIKQKQQAVACKHSEQRAALQPKPQGGKPSRPKSL
jgi:type IV pilus assembly protein PilA